MGFDGLEETLVSRSVLSTVVQPTADEGRGAVRALLELIEHPERAPIQRFLPTELALRRSCGCGREAESVQAIDSVQSVQTTQSAQPATTRLTAVDVMAGGDLVT